MQRAGQGVAAQHPRQGDEHLDRVVVDAAQQQKHEQAERQPEQRPADRLLGEQQCHAAGTLAVVAGADQSQYDGEHHHPDAVVEQRLAGYQGLDVLAHAEPLEDPQHRDGIGRRDQRPEQQRVQKRQLEPDQTQHEEDQHRHQERRQHHPGSGQDQDRPLLFAESAEVDVQRAGKQQKAEHPLEHECIEVEARQETLRLGHQSCAAEQQQRQ